MDREKKVEIAFSIISEFEEYLDEHDITIPSRDRIGDPDEARIFGTEYYDIEEAVIDIISEKCDPSSDKPIMTEFENVLRDARVIDPTGLSGLRCLVRDVLRREC